MENFLLNKTFKEHHLFPNGELISGEELPGLPFSICFNKRKGKNCIEIKENSTLHTSYFIGIDWITEKKAIFVEPKINNEENQINYLKMLFEALSHSGTSTHSNELFEIKFDKPQIKIKSQHDMLTPLLVVQFLQLARKIVRKGLKNSYYKTEQNLYGRIKGKIMVGQTLKQNVFKNKPLNTYCTFDEFGRNGLENRLLKKTLVFIQRYLPAVKNFDADKYTSEIFNYVMPAFEFVSDKIDLNEIKHTKTNAFYKEYEEAIDLAKLILKRFGYNIINAQESVEINTPPFWIDMSKLFELYVYGQLLDKENANLHYQFGEERGETFYGKPDFLLTGNEAAIIDSKYKTRYIPERVSFDEYLIKDIRQLAGYGRDKKVLSKLGYREDQFVTAVPKCLIIYPDQNASENLWENPEEPIDQFSNFHKRAIKLPIIRTMVCEE